MNVQQIRMGGISKNIGISEYGLDDDLMMSYSIFMYIHTEDMDFPMIATLCLNPHHHGRDSRPRLLPIVAVEKLRGPENLGSHLEFQ